VRGFRAPEINRRADAPARAITAAASPREYDRARLDHEKWMTPESEVALMRRDQQTPSTQ